MQAFTFSMLSSAQYEGVSIASILLKYVGKSRGEISAFARAVGVSPGQITNVMKGRRLPRPEILVLWAGQLPIDVRDEWMRESYLAHAPDQVRQMMADLERRTAALESAAESVVRERDELREENALLRAQIANSNRRKP